MVRVLCTLVAISILFGCTGTGTTYLAVYGDKIRAVSEIDRLLAAEEIAYETVDIPLPAGLHSSVVLYGPVDGAEQQAKIIAYALSRTLGRIVPVRPLGVASHSYTRENIAIYLVEPATALTLERDAEDTWAIQAGDNYATVDCDAFQGVLTLSSAGTYSLEATRYAESGAESDILMQGRWVNDSNRLSIEFESRMYPFARQRKAYPYDFAVTQLVLVSLSPELLDVSVLGCGFEQLIEVAAGSR